MGRKPSNRGQNSEALAVLNKIFASRPMIVNIYAAALIEKMNMDQFANRALQEAGEEIPVDQMEYFKKNLKIRYLQNAEAPSSRGYLNKLQDMVEHLDSLKIQQALHEKLADENVRLADVEKTPQLQQIVWKIKESAGSLKMTPEGLFARQKKAYKEKAQELSKRISIIQEDAGLCGIKADGNIWWPEGGGSSKKADPYSIAHIEDVLPNIGDIKDLGELNSWLESI